MSQRKPTKAQRAKAVRVLNAMLKLFAKNQWIQGRYRERDNEGNVVGYCLVGALNEAGDGEIAGNALRQATKEPGFLENWNDDDNRTKRQVLAAIRKAKKLVETEAV